MSSLSAIISDHIVFPEGVSRGCLVFENEKITERHAAVPAGFSGKVWDFSGRWVLPGLVDSHVHINEPGRTEWEGFATATQAAAAGGITTLVDMPLNCQPVTTSAAHLRTKLAAVGSQLTVDTGFWGGVTPDSLADLPELLEAGVLGVKSFLIDSGIPEFPPMTAETLEPAMRVLAAAGLPYLFHAELELPSSPGLPPVQRYADFLRSRPPEWELAAIRLVIELSRKTRCRSHIVHLSAAEALADLHTARASGVPISAETCPHYLLLNAEEIDARPDSAQSGVFKCCPPIRGRANAQALWEGLCRGDITCVVSDHSPCTANLKAGELGKAWGGIASLQFGLPLIVSLGSLGSLGRARGFAGPNQVEEPALASAIAGWMCGGPARLAGLFDRKGSLEIGKDADFAIFDPAGERAITIDEILYRNKLTPYAGMRVQGRVQATFLRGAPVYENGAVVDPPRGKTLLRMNPRRSTP